MIGLENPISGGIDEGAASRKLKQARIPARGVGPDIGRQNAEMGEHIADATPANCERLRLDRAAATHLRPDGG